MPLLDFFIILSVAKTKFCMKSKVSSIKIIFFIYLLLLKIINATTANKTIVMKPPSFPLLLDVCQPREKLKAGINKIIIYIINMLILIKR